MFTRVFLILASVLWSHSAIALEKRVIEPGLSGQAFHRTVFDALAMYESQSDQITLEMGRRGTRTYTLVAQFENPEEGSGSDLLEEKIQCRKERDSETDLFLYTCRFELYDDNGSLRAAFYEEGVSSVFSDAIFALVDRYGPREGSLAIGTTGTGNIGVSVFGSGRVFCERSSRAGRSSCRYDLSHYLSPEAVQVALEEIRAREPWFNGLEESFQLNDLELGRVELKIHFVGNFELTARYASSDSERTGKTLILKGRYRGTSSLEMTEFTHLSINI